MKKSVIFVVLGVIALVALGLLSGMGVAWGQEPYDDPTSCDVADCHQGIEPIRAPDSMMMESVSENSRQTSAKCTWGFHLT